MNKEFYKGLASSINWQPIETAPKDGTSILARIRGYRPAVVEWLTFEGESRWFQDPETFSTEDEFKENWGSYSEWKPNEWFPIPQFGEE